MRIFTCANAAEFLDSTGDALRADEVRHGIMYSLALRMSDARLSQETGSALYLTFLERDQPCAAALLNQSGTLYLSLFSGDPQVTAEMAGAALHNENREVSGTIGDTALCEAFSKTWQRHCGISGAVVTEYRIYKLETLQPVPVPDGTFRCANGADKPLVAQWGKAFHHEVTGGAAAPPAEPFENRVDSGTVYVWETSRPVCMAGATRPLYRSIGIGPVYTPPEFRNRGYARACVAHLCRCKLDEGYSDCTLFVDKSNSASASLYKQIGFEGVNDFVEIVFPQKTG